MRYEKKLILSEIEKSTKKQQPILEITEEQAQTLKTASGYLLTLIAVSGIVAVSAVAPNLLSALGKLHRTFRGKKKLFKEKQQAVADTFFYLKRHGYIELSESQEGVFAKLTKKGKSRAQTLNIENIKIKKPPVWDGKWWLVAADIPTKTHRVAADMLRRKIKQLGLFPLQRTMWFYPYNPEAEIEYIVRYYGVENFVTLMEVSRLDKDDEFKLKQHFNM